MRLVKVNPYQRLECDTGLIIPELPDMVGPEDVLIVAPLHNSGSKNDATGAFHPGARAFSRVHGLDQSAEFRWDNRLGRYAQADAVIREMERREPKVLAAFCHGYQHGVQFGLRSPGHRFRTEIDVSYWERFITALSTHNAAGYTAPVVVLYACSTGDDPDDDPDTAPGSGDGSFADLLRDALCDRWATQCRVMAHTTAGHTWLNPQVKMFDGDGDVAGGVGAELLAVDGDDEGESFREESRKLAALLRTDWAFTFPFRPIDAIRSDL